MRIADVLDQLLECASDAIEDRPVCRTFVNPGPNAAHDACEVINRAGNIFDGQLWVAHLGSLQGWPGPTGLPYACTTDWNESYEIGITRCAAKLNDQGQAPPPDDVTADAAQQEADRVALKDAFLCCLSIDHKDLIIIGWEPIPPQGGCVGGVWTIQIRDGGCDCGSMES